MFFSKNTVLRFPTKRQQLSFLIMLAAGCMVHTAQAATIYQCKQADGRVAFQEMPCAATATQAEVGKTTHAAPPPAAKAKASVAAPSSAAAAAATGYDACSQAGTQLFDPSREQSLQHPQAALNGCRKAVPAAMSSDNQCLQTCLQSWVGEYQKKYVSKDK